MRIGAVVAVASACVVLVGCSARVSPVAAAQGSCSLSPAQEFTELQPYVRAMAVNDLLLAAVDPGFNEATDAASIKGPFDAANTAALSALAESAKLTHACPSDPDGSSLGLLAAMDRSLLNDVSATTASGHLLTVAELASLVSRFFTAFGVSIVLT